mmetsp:Transcript_16006/g.34642  ORF Transcript_16006/g.34642 Transcript_16006/m.34642 type:complete len:222 (+) Transcript_16006:920-1585(+)
MSRIMLLKHSLQSFAEQLHSESSVAFQVDYEEPFVCDLTTTAAGTDAASVRNCRAHAWYSTSWCSGERTPSRRWRGAPKEAHQRTGQPAAIAEAAAFSATSASPQSTNTHGTQDGESAFTIHPSLPRSSFWRSFQPGSTRQVCSMYARSFAAAVQNACATVLHDHGVCNFLNVLYHRVPHAIEPRRSPGQLHSLVHELRTIKVSGYFSTSVSAEWSRQLGP